MLGGWGKSWGGQSCTPTRFLPSNGERKWKPRSSSEGNGITYLGDNLDVLWKVPVTTLSFVALHGAVVFSLSAVINRIGIAAPAYFGLLTAGTGIAGRVAEAPFEGARWASLLALDTHPRIIRDYSKLQIRSVLVERCIPGFLA